MEQLPVLIRPMAESDINFMLDSWLKTLFKSVLFFGSDFSLYQKTAKPIVLELLKKCGAIVACNPKEPSQIFGYVVAEYIENITIYHWMYVKSTFRNFGIGKMLLKAVFKLNTIPFSTFNIPEELCFQGRARMIEPDRYNRLKYKITAPNHRKALSIPYNSRIFVETKQSEMAPIYHPLLLIKLNEYTDRKPCYKISKEIEKCLNKVEI